MLGSISFQWLCYISVKYLGLLAMSKILQTHPKSVQTHKDLILQCLDDKDESIRFRALDLLYGMVSCTVSFSHTLHVCRIENDFEIQQTQFSW